MRAAVPKNVIMSIRQTVEDQKSNAQITELSGLFKYTQIFFLL